MKTNTTSDAARAYKRLECVKSFYSHLTAWVTLNLFLVVGYYTLDGVHEDFWHVSFAVITVLGGLGLLGHFMGVFGYRIFFSEKQEKRALRLAFNEIENNSNKTNPDMENIATPEQLTVERARRRVKALKGFYKHLAAYVIVNAALLVTSYYKGDYLQKQPHEFWSFQTFSTPIFWGIGLLCHAFNTFGTSLLFGKGWEDRKIKEYIDNNNGDTSSTKWE
ncbi:MAG: 2TM domain-containing protein [Bacteroidia bacterium]